MASVLNLRNLTTKLNNLLIVKSLFPAAKAACSSDAPFLKYKDVKIPEKNKLRFYEKVPPINVSIKPLKCGKRLLDIRGQELVHTELIHKQYGIIALTGGNLLSGHMEMIRQVINRKMDTKTMFAVWRVDPPWKPITKKSQGKRMGGGKANIHHYVTPVKAGRVILEMGGKAEYLLVKRLLDEVILKLPFKAMAVDEDSLAALRAKEKQNEDENINPYSFKYVVENNMLGCHGWVGPYDFIWHGKYR